MHFRTNILLQIDFEFGVIYKNNDPNVFVTNWPTYASKLKNLMKVEYKSQMFVTKWPPEIEDLFMLLKLLPFKSNGRNGAASAATFRDSIQKLVVFSNVMFTIIFHLFTFYELPVHIIDRNSSSSNTNYCIRD